MRESGSYRHQWEDRHQAYRRRGVRVCGDWIGERRPRTPISMWSAESMPRPSSILSSQSSVRGPPGAVAEVLPPATQNPGPPRRGLSDTNLRSTNGAWPAASLYRISSLRQFRNVDVVNSGNRGTAMARFWSRGAEAPLQATREQQLATGTDSTAN